MAAKTLSVYIRDEALFDKIKAAQADSTINVNEVCSKALDEALHPAEAVAEQPDNYSLADMAAAAELLNQQPQDEIEYEFSFSNSPQEAMAFLQHIASQGAFPVSLTIEPNTGRFCFLVGYPKALAAQPE